MTDVRLLIKEIYSCGDCSHLVFDCHDQYGCLKINDWSKIIDRKAVSHGTPDWCPLPKKEEQECRDEK